MNTVVSKIYIDKIEALADRFASARSMLFLKNYQKKVYKSTYSVYYDISLYLYIKLNKTSQNRRKFNFNKIDSRILKKFSCKLYHKVLLDLAENQMIVINNHYFNSADPIKAFSKSYLIHKDIFSRIDESKYRFKYEMQKIEIPQKVVKALKMKAISDEDEMLFTQSKLNRFYRKEHTEKEKLDLNFYDKLDYDEKSLNSFCKDDELMYNFNKRRLLRLNQQPKKIKGRFYHPFHEFSKKFRESVLRFERRAA